MRIKLVYLAILLGLTPALVQAQQSVGPSGLSSDGTCFLEDLPCWGKGSKCNIKFKNRTGISKRTCGWKTVSQTKTIQLSTRLDSKRVGRKRSVSAGASLTLNLDNRVESGGFDRIRVESTDALVKRVVLTCADVREILREDRDCRVFYDERWGSSGLPEPGSSDDVSDNRKRENFLAVSCGGICARP